MAAGTSINYGSAGFPPWVYELAQAFGLQASTYPGHQENTRVEAGFDPNPQRLNRGIDWTGSVSAMQAFADYLLNYRQHLEQVIWENPTTGERVGVAGGTDVSATPYYQSDYAGHRDHVHTRQSRPIPIPAGKKIIPAKEKTLRPDFNEYPHWSPNNQNRNGTKIDLFLLHTQEGNGNADSLGRYLRPPAMVSYHYTVSQDPRDNGVTVVDIVDTDLASWSVLSANNRSINLCFAGSSVNWSHDQWMKNSKAIDAAAWLAVQDCKKYGIPTTVIAPPYTAGRAGISDHAYVSKILRDGNHSDVGPNFPWPYFASKVAEYAGTKPVAPPVAPPKPDIPTPPASYTDRQLLEAIFRRIDGLAAALEKKADK